MKKGINAWCFPANFTVKQCIEKAKEAGYDGIELNMSETDLEGADKEPNLTINATEREIQEIYGFCKDTGIPVSSVSTSLLWKYSLTSEDEATRNKGVDIVKRMIDAAVLLNTDAILVVPGVVNEKVSYKDAYMRSLEAFKKLRQKAEENRVYIGIENVWNKFLLSPIEMRNFIDEIGSPYVRAYFDVGNVLAFSYPEYWIEVLSDYIVRVHVKDFDTSIGNIHGFKNLLQGDVNWPRVMASLKKVGYKSYLTAELSPYRVNPELLVYDTSRHLDTILSL